MIYSEREREREREREAESECFVVVVVELIALESQEHKLCSIQQLCMHMHAYTTAPFVLVNSCCILNAF